MKTIWHLVLEADEDKDDTTPAEDEATNYSEDAPTETDDTSSETKEDNTTDDEIDPAEDGATDYGEDAPADDEDSSMDTDSTDTDDTTDVQTDASPEEVEENKSNSILIDDYLNVYYSIQNVIIRLSKIDKSNMNVNKVVARVTSNLIRIRSDLFEYIKYQFGRSNYTGNLLRYNYFIEAYRINTAILRKTKVFIPISQNNNVKNIRKEVH